MFIIILQNKLNENIKYDECVWSLSMKEELWCQVVIYLRNSFMENKYLPVVIRSVNRRRERKKEKQQPATCVCECIKIAKLE